MKNLLVLTKVMAKSSGEEILKGRKHTQKKASRYATYGLYIFLGIYMLGLAGSMSYLLINNLNKVNQVTLSFKLLFLLINGLCLFTALIATPTVLYFSKDIESYLVLPVKPWEILGAKFLTSLLSTYLIGLVVMIPFISVYFYITGFDVMTLILYSFTMVLAPLFPTALVTLFIIIIFTFIPFVRNKDLFTYFTILLSLGMSLWFSFNINYTEMSAETISDLFTSGNNTLINLMQSAFNPSSHFANAVIKKDVLSLLYGFLIAAALLAVLGIVSQKLYFKGAIGIQESASKKVVLDSKKKLKLSKSNSQVISLMKQDLKNVLKTPILMTNYFIPSVLLPFMMIIPLVLEVGFDNLGTILNVAKDFVITIPTGDLIQYVVLLGFFIGFTITTLSSMPSTSFSREGGSIQNYLTMPLKLKTLYHSKIMLSVISLSVVPVLMVTLIGFALNLNLILIAMMLIMAIYGSIVASVIACLFDIIGPKLKWETEQQAVKQNFMAMVAMFVEMGLIGLIIYTFIKLSFAHAFLVITLGSGALLVGIYVVSITLLDTHLRSKIEES